MAEVQASANFVGWRERGGGRRVSGIKQEIVVNGAWMGGGGYRRAMSSEEYEGAEEGGGGKSRVLGRR